MKGRREVNREREVREKVVYIYIYVWRKYGRVLCYIESKSNKEKEMVIKQWKEKQKEREKGGKVWRGEIKRKRGVWERKFSFETGVFDLSYKMIRIE